MPATMTRRDADAVILACARRMGFRIGAPDDFTIAEAVALGLTVGDPVARVLEPTNFEIGKEADKPDPRRAAIAQACRLADERAEAGKAIDDLIGDRRVRKFLDAVGDLSIRGVADALEDRAAAMIAERGDAAAASFLRDVAGRLTDAEGG